MASYLLFAILGLGSGAVYAILGLGLVLKHRSAGVLDFSHGAVAMWIAYVFVGLRGSGALVLPWIGPGHQVQLTSGGGISTGPALVIAVAYAALLGAIFYAVVVHPLRNAPALARVGASVGLMLAFQAIAVIDFGTITQSTPPIFPQWRLTVDGLAIPTDGLVMAVITAVIAVVLAVVYRKTRFGLMTTAAAENQAGAALTGISPGRIALINWVLATALAGLAGALVLPITTLSPGTYTLFVVPALAVALLARFRSFSVTLIGGLTLGVLQSELTKMQSIWTWLPQQGTQDGLPFVLIMIVMTVLGRNVLGRGALSELRAPSIGRPRRPATTAVGTVVVGSAAILLTSTLYRDAIVTSIVTTCICLSVVVLTGYVGQISLAQNALAGISAFTLSHIAQRHGIDFPVAILLSALCSVAVGLLIGLPALRVRGVNLAVLTLATASALDALVFSNRTFTGGFDGRVVASPSLFGLDLSGARTYGITVLVIVVAVGVAVAKLRNSDGGRILIAIRSNERAAAAAGIDVARMKLFAFAFSAFIAGIGGCLLAYQQVHINGDSFVVWSSLSILAITYVGGLGRISGAVAAGLMLSSAGLVPTLLNRVFDFGQYQTLIAGLALIITAIGNPDGVASEMGAAAGAVGRLVRRSVTGRQDALDEVAVPSATAPHVERVRVLDAVPADPVPAAPGERRSVKGSLR